MRIEDLGIGDVVNRDPESEVGWFEVAATQVLFNGDLQLADRTALITISGPFYTLVGVQFVSPANIPDQPASPLPPEESDEEFDDGSTAFSEEATAEDEPMATPAALVG